MKATSVVLLASLLFCFRSTLATQSNTSQLENIPTVDFCEMVKHPELYFDKTIRIAATMELGDEGSNLNDVRCVRSHDDSIGVGAVAREQQDKSFQKDFEKIRDGHWDTQPRVTVIGILRNSSLRAFAWYRYRFDIMAFEDIRQELSETIVTFDGSLREGFTYRGTVHGDKDFGLSFNTPLHVPMHHAVRLEWTNLKQFRVLQQLRGTSEKQIVFRVVKDNLDQIDAQRWDRTFQLEILLVE
jgi:hypothetical protein